MRVTPLSVLAGEMLRAMNEKRWSAMIDLARLGEQHYPDEPFPGLGSWPEVIAWAQRRVDARRVWDRLAEINAAEALLTR